MNRRNFGILATVIGSAMAAWWWNRQRTHGAHGGLTPARERGTVIYDNTPTSEGII